MTPESRGFAPHWSGRAGNGMFTSTLPGLCFISNTTLLLPPSVSLPRYGRHGKILSHKGETSFNIVLTFIHIVTLDTSLNFFSISRKTYSHFQLLVEAYVDRIHESFMEESIYSNNSHSHELNYIAIL